jgi:hypothetical protein
MSTDPIVHKQPAVQSNPFAKHAAEHVSAGAVAIESERAIAEAQGKLVIAKRFPRNQAVAYANIIDACRRPGLAEEACYSFPRGGEVVSGPAIRLAEMLAANWGNVDYGIRELSRKEGVSEMEAYCWDLETNTMSSQKFTVRHIRDRRGGNVALTDERDIYELTANMGARRLRARILAILPADLVQAAVDQCSKTLATGGDMPIQDRIRKMIVAFKSLGIPSALIEKRLGHALDTTSGEELADLTKIHNSLRDNMSRVGDWFGDGPKSQDDENLEGDPVPRPDPKPRAKKGAAAVAENPAPAKEVVGEIVPEATTTVVEPTPAPVSETVVAPPPEPAPAAPEVAPAAPATRAFLQDGESLTATVRVTGLKAAVMKSGEVSIPTTKATLTGGFVGDVYHKDGAKAEGVGYVPLPPWKVGAELTVTLLGQKNKSGAVLAYVQAVAEAQEEF